jgi:hypothetical protein
MATALQKTSQAEFYREWLMGRPAFDPKVYGIEMDRDEFTDR